MPNQTNKQVLNIKFICSNIEENTQCEKVFELTVDPKEQHQNEEGLKHILDIMSNRGIPGLREIGSIVKVETKEKNSILQTIEALTGTSNVNDLYLLLRSMPIAVHEGIMQIMEEREEYKEKAKYTEEIQKVKIRNKKERSLRKILNQISKDIIVLSARVELLERPTYDKDPEVDEEEDAEKDEEEDAEKDEEEDKAPAWARVGAPVEVNDGRDNWIKGKIIERVSDSTVLVVDETGESWDADATNPQDLRPAAKTKYRRAKNTSVT